MNIKRVKIWFRNSPDVYLSNEAQALVSKMGCVVRAFDLHGKGETATIAMFPQETPVLALIDSDTPHWAEAAVARLFKEDGSPNHKWEVAA